MRFPLSFLFLNTDSGTLHFSLVKYLVFSLTVIFFAVVTIYIYYLLQGKKSKYDDFKVLKKFVISKDYSILIVDLYGQIYVLGLSKGSISLLDKRSDLTKEDFKRQEVDFSDILSKVRKKS